MNHSAPLRRARFVGARAPSTLALAACLVFMAILAVQSPLLMELCCLVTMFFLRFPSVASYLVTHPLLKRLGGMRTIGILGGTLLFCTITIHGDAAHAQLFNKVEQQTNGIFGSYIDPNIVKFLFGMLRVVVWVTAVGHLMAAVFQAQRGEQWQPLMINGFVIIASVVVVEALGAMFFGGGGTTKAGG